MQLYEFESRLNRPVKMKIPEFERNERLKHVIFADQFDRGLLDHLGRVATMIKEIARSKDGHRFLQGLLPHKGAMLYFTQASTRTFLSFMRACQILGMKVAEIRDPSLSSEYKGESPLDSLRMFSSYFDLIIMRSKVPNLAECCAYLMNDLDQFNQRSVPVINGGAGADEHPTQALLDIYTIQRVFEFKSPRDSSVWNRFDDLRRKYPDLNEKGRGPDRKVYGFCGDIGRGRTVRSLANLLTRYEDVTMYFIAPDHPTLRPSPEFLNQLKSKGVRVFESHDLGEVIGELDLLYMTRIQNEHNSPEEEAFFKQLDYSRFQLSEEMLKKMREYTAILHPFPRNQEIPTFVDQDPRAMYFRQARNGMWVRAALIAYLFDMDGRIVSYHTSTFSSFHDYNERVLKA
ncbi:MAG: aspartate carbamoyltransferase [Bacteroidetes bacterium]|nr:MAG: aspartate carbamoyltransferase [Bacteroidota bacterium]